MIKELVTNAFKHSGGSKLRVILTQTDGQIELTVKDNGNAAATSVQAALDSRQGKGLLSIQEQSVSLGGRFTVTENKPKGLCVSIALPMKGEGSYQHFIGR
jgi:two-component system secretion system sensor histidine kinase SalK